MGEPHATELPAISQRSPCTACDGDGTVNHATEPDMLDVCRECLGHGVAYRVPTAADLVAHVAAMPSDDAAGLLVALLRSRPDEAVAAVDACKVARSWNSAWRMPLAGGRFAATIGWDDDIDTWWWETGSRPIATGESGADTGAQAAADAALLADGWALAGVTRG